jgi:hypothetical protein
MMQEVSEVRPPTTWAARGVDGAIRPSATITIEPLDDGLSSRVTFALDFEGQGIGRAVAAVRASADTEGGAAQLPEAQGTCGGKETQSQGGGWLGSARGGLRRRRVGTSKTGPAAGSNGIAQHGGGVATPWVCSRLKPPWEARREREVQEVGEPTSGMHAPELPLRARAVPWV